MSITDILDLVDLQELRSEVQKKYRGVAAKPEATYQLSLAVERTADPLFTNQTAIEFSSRFSLSMYSKDVH